MNQDEIDNLLTERDALKAYAEWAKAKINHLKKVLDGIREMAIEDIEQDLGGTNLYQIEADANAAIKEQQ